MTQIVAIVAALVRFGAGYRTYIAAAGMLGLAVYQVSQKDYATAYQTFMAALGLFGIRASITNILKPLAPVAPAPAPAPAPETPRA